MQFTDAGIGCTVPASQMLLSGVLLGHFHPTGQTSHTPEVLVKYPACKASPRVQTADTTEILKMSLATSTNKNNM